MKKGPFKMKAGKEGPMKKNFGISPMKDDTYGARKKFAKEEAERKSKLATIENFAGGEKSYEEINTAANEEYLEKGNKAVAEITKKTNKKLKEAESYNKSRANYLKYAASISKGSSKSKGTLRGN